MVGRAYVRFLAATGHTDEPLDLSQMPIHALIADETQASGYRVSAGQGSADGTFTIPDVPDGTPYLLRFSIFGDTLYFATTSHVIDLHGEEVSRRTPPPIEAAPGTKVSFNIQDMTPFVNGPERVSSYIQIQSQSLGHRDTIYLPNNAQSLTMIYDWSGRPLPEAALSDDLMITHRRRNIVPSSSGRRQYLTRVIDTFMPTGVTIANGTTTNVNGSWAAAASNRSIDMVVTRGAFEVGHDGNSRGGQVSVRLTAVPVIRGVVDGALVFETYVYDSHRPGTSNELFSFACSDPFPADWSRVLGVGYYRERCMRVPNTMSRGCIGSWSDGFVSAYSYAGGELKTSPALQPAANFKVAAKEASPGGLVFFDRVAPIELTWSVVPAAKLYSVRVERLFQEGTYTRTKTIATLSTGQTSIRIPAEVFAGSDFFAFVVTAVQTPADYNAGQLIANGIPSGGASALSGLFRLSDHCGNGIQEADEECDTSGESATCDVDCTLPSCGDGLRNGSAGEACDAAQDTSSCDFNCTLPVCGDGYVNRTLEDCDDGNAVDDDNGCSSTCRFDNYCGNGFLELGEYCDPGDADALNCDRDCSYVYCGDGHLNAAAGEGCDDGNYDDNDGCTRMCQAT